MYVPLDSGHIDCIASHDTSSHTSEYFVTCNPCIASSASLFEANLMKPTGFGNKHKIIDICIVKRFMKRKSALKLESPFVNTRLYILLSYGRTNILTLCSIWPVNYTCNLLSILNWFAVQYDIADLLTRFNTFAAENVYKNMRKCRLCKQIFLIFTDTIINYILVCIKICEHAENANIYFKYLLILLFIIY